jgi:hypothetical protein
MLRFEQRFYKRTLGQQWSRLLVRKIEKKQQIRNELWLSFYFSLAFVPILKIQQCDLHKVHVDHVNVSALSY